MMLGKVELDLSYYYGFSIELIATAAPPPPPIGELFSQHDRYIHETCRLSTLNGVYIQRGLGGIIFFVHPKKGVELYNNQFSRHLT